MAGDWKAERERLAATAREMGRLGLVSGTSGNASMRLSTGDSAAYLVTPSGRECAGTTPDELVAVDGSLEPLEGDGVPSSESQLHLAIYSARPDVSAVVHTHSVYATALAAAGRPLPPVIDELVMYVGGQVEVAAYGFPGSEELASAAVEALGDRRSVLLRNHGVVAAADTPEEALRISALVERAAHVCLIAELAGGATCIPADALAAERAVYLMRAGLQ